MYNVKRNGQTYEELIVGLSQPEIDAQTAWFDTAEALHVRYEAHSDILSAMNQSSFDGTNDALMYNDIIQNHNSALMDELETFEAAAASFKAEQDSLDESRDMRLHGLKVIDYINHLNKAHIVSSQDIRDLYDHADSKYVKWCLESGSLVTARATVAAMDLSTIVTTESDRTKILAKLDEY